MPPSDPYCCKVRFANKPVNPELDRSLNCSCVVVTEIRIPVYNTTVLQAALLSNRLGMHKKDNFISARTLMADIEVDERMLTQVLGTHKLDVS